MSLKSKKTVVMGAVLAIGASSLVSVGFASWIISNKQVKDEQVGVSVDAQAERVFTNFSDVAWKDNKSSFQFGAPATQDTENHWLTASGDPQELLTLEATWTYTLMSGYTPNVTADVTVKNESGDAKPWGNAVDATYVGGTPTASVTTTNNGQVYTTKVTLTAAWGQYFGGDNPYTFYNGQDSTAKRSGSTKTYAEEAYDVLTSTVFSNLKDAKFNLKVTFTAAPTNG